MKQNIILTVLLIAVSLITINCSKKGGINEPPNYDGTWSGTTSQGKSFSLTVSGGSITSIYIGYSLSGSCSSAPTGQTMTFYTPRTISGNSFSISGSTNISGTFSSANKAGGSFSMNFTGVSGCSSTASGTWTASK